MKTASQAVSAARPSWTPQLHLCPRPTLTALVPTRATGASTAPRWDSPPPPCRARPHPPRSAPLPPGCQRQRRSRATGPFTSSWPTAPSSAFRSSRPPRPSWAPSPARWRPCPSPCSSWWRRSRPSCATPCSFSETRSTCCATSPPAYSHSCRTSSMDDPSCPSFSGANYGREVPGTTHFPLFERVTVCTPLLSGAGQRCVVRREDNECPHTKVAPNVLLDRENGSDGEMFAK